MFRPPKPLNKALINNYHNQVPSLKTIHRFTNKKAIKFSKLDIRSRFWHWKLNDKAREQTAFGTPQGYYRYKILPIGITPASQPGIPSKNDQTIPRGKWGQHYSRWLVKGLGNNSDQAINNHNQGASGGVMVANLHERVWVSLGAPFIWPCATLKQRAL